MRLSQCSILRPSPLIRKAAGSTLLQRRSLLTLAIETSCDDTAVAILSRPDDRRRPAALLFNERISSDNRAFKGVHPTVTVVGHTNSLASLVRRALASLPPPDAASAGSDGIAAASKVCLGPDGSGRQVPDFVSVTRGPGILPNLSVGLNTAKGLAVAWGVPLVGVHHMQAHALTPRLVSALKTSTETEARDRKAAPEFPFLSLLVSGGHTQLVHSASLTEHRIVATTHDTALGNLLDQTARVILPPDVLAASPDVMYGRQLEAFAFPADAPDPYAFFRPAASRRDEMLDVDTGYEWTVPQPFRGSRRLAYSFSSIYTDVHRIAAANPDMSVVERRALAAHTMATAFGHLAGRLVLALEDEPSLRPAAHTLVVSGGVACNRFLKHVLRTTLAARGFGDVEIVAPPVELCTDNAAMVAWAGMEMFEAGWHTDLSVLGIAKWPMDPELGHGIMGAGGWLKRDGFE